MSGSVSLRLHEPSKLCWAVLSGASPEHQSSGANPVLAAAEGASTALWSEFVVFFRGVVFTFDLGEGIGAVMDERDGVGRPIGAKSAKKAVSAPKMSKKKEHKSFPF